MSGGRGPDGRDTDSDRAMHRAMAARLVAVAQPTAVILFGSRARGEAVGDSDVDWLVVLPDDDRRRLRDIEVLLRRSLAEFPRCIDVLAFREADLRRYRDDWSHVIGRAVAEGQVFHGQP